MKERKSEREKLIDELEDLSNTDFKGRYLVSESQELIKEALEKGIPLPHNLRKYVQNDRSPH